VFQTLHDGIDRLGIALADALEAGSIGLDFVRQRVVAGIRRLRGICRRDPLPCRPLVAMAAAVCAGCVLGPMMTAGHAGAAWAVTLGCWSCAGALLAAWAATFRAARHATAAWVLLASIASAAAGWAVARDRLFSADDLAWRLHEMPTPVAVEGTVVESPRRLPPPSVSASGVTLEAASECIVDVSRVRIGAAWKAASGRAAVVVTGPPPDCAAGCRVRIVGRGLRPAHPLNPGEFDFRARARSDRCLSLVRCQSADCINLIQPPIWSVAAWLDRIRCAGTATLDTHLGSRSGIAAALLLGSREAIAAEDSREFLVTGTIHILSISGLHVGILALGLYRLLRLIAVRRSRALVAVAVSTGLYMLLVGAETPVVRATLLVWLSCLAAGLGRRSPAINALAAAAIVILVWHPPEVFRIGTQLSFLSTAVLVGAATLVPRPGGGDDPIERLIESSRTPTERWLRRLVHGGLAMMVTGVAIWCVTAPIVAARFNVVSPIGLVLNPLIAPLVPLAMAWGFLCLIATPFSGWLAGLCGAGCDATLALIEHLVGWAADLPGAYLWVAGPAAWWVVGAYLWLLLVLIALPRERLVRCRTWVAAATIWCGVGAASALAASLVNPRPMGLEVTVVSLGHGCGVVVRSPAGRVLVCDAGRLGAPAAARRAVSAVLWTSGISRIDTLVVSHADADHFNAMPDLLERFAVGEFVVSRTFLGSEAPAVHELLRLVHERRIPVRCVAVGDEIPCDPLCRVRVVHHEPRAQEDNETSLVLAVESAGRRLLLTGDLEGEALARFVDGDPDRCDVLLAPHHGSVTSLPPAIAGVTAPTWVIVSGPGGARWGEVERAYRGAAGPGRAARVVKTAGVGRSSGAARLWITAQGVEVRQYHAGRWAEVPPPFRPSRPSHVSNAMPLPPGARGSG